LSWPGGIDLRPGSVLLLEVSDSNLSGVNLDGLIKRRTWNGNPFYFFYSIIVISLIRNRKSCLGKISHFDNRVAWAPVARSSFQGRTRGIPGSIPRGNNAWPVCMPLRTSRISRPPLVGRKPLWKPKKKLVTLTFRFYVNYK